MDKRQHPRFPARFSQFLYLRHRGQWGGRCDRSVAAWLPSAESYRCAARSLSGGPIAVLEHEPPIQIQQAVVSGAESINSALSL